MASYHELDIREHFYKTGEHLELMISVQMKIYLVHKYYSLDLLCAIKANIA